MSVRKKELKAARDMKMFERYYYWTEVRRLRFDDAVKKLSEEEFFVSEERVMQIVRKMIRDGATVPGEERGIGAAMYCGARNDRRG